jgi:branched-chain amino acid transport system substrate-binding protein
MGMREIGGTYVMIEFMEYLAKVVGKKFERPAIIYEDTDYGQSGAIGLRKFLAERGYRIVEDISYPSRTPDVTPVISRLKTARTDLVLMVPYLGDAILLAKTADRLGLHVPSIDAAGRSQYPYIRVVGDISEYDFSITFWNKDIGPKGKEMNDRYKAKMGEYMASQPAVFYQAVWVVKEALELAKKADREALREAMTKIQINPGPTLYMPWKFIKFGDDGMSVGTTPNIIQVQNREFVTIYPEMYASSKVKVDPKWWK